MPETMISVTVCYARSANDVWLSALSMPVGSTVADAIAQSDVYQKCRIAQTDIAGCGVFGVRQPDSYVLHEGDRVELYRALTFDPKESRRRRAAHRKAGILKRKHLKKSKIAWQEYMETPAEGTGEQNRTEEE